MYTIGDVINNVGITRRTLHYYDRIGLLNPVVDPENGYRYYDDSALMKLQTILSLKTMGFALDEIRSLLNEHRPPAHETEDPWIAPRIKSKT